MKHPLVLQITLIINAHITDPVQKEFKMAKSRVLIIRDVELRLRLYANIKSIHTSMLSVFIETGFVNTD